LKNIKGVRAGAILVLSYSKFFWDVTKMIPEEGDIIAL